MASDVPTRRPTAVPGGEFDLVMMVWGRLNVFRRAAAAGILANAADALAPGGALLLETQPHDCVKATGARPPAWRTCEAGLFSDRPHVVLEEHFWDEAAPAATSRFYVIDVADVADGAVSRYALSNAAYTDLQYQALLAEAGFTDVRLDPSSMGVYAEDDEQQLLLTVVAGKKPR